MITLLPDPVINQIAAGEVVENPASVVKEILENALDAGSTRLEIELEGGGHHLIRVVDNGCGMGRADLEICLLRHATSKIRDIADLEQLMTMGFRGEALAAIASVSQLQIDTSDGKEATRLVAEGGKVSHVGPVARNRGTTLEIRSLFFNAPARRKFQKGSRVSQMQIVRVVESIALAHPEIAFCLRAGGETLLEVEAGGAREKAILGWEGKRIAGLGVSGIVGEGQMTRAGQFLYVNRRSVFSPLVSRAVKEAVGTRIGEGQHPRFLLFLELNPREVDVNVHPQKKEVRFRDEAAIFAHVGAAVRNAFELPRAVETFEAPTFTFREEVQPQFEWTSAPRAEAMSFLLEVDERYVALAGPFLLLEDAEGIFCVDVRQLAGSLLQGKPEAEPLLFPMELDLEEPMPLDRLAALGIEARMLSERRLVVDAMPVGFAPSDFPHFLKAARSGRPLDLRALPPRKYSRDEAMHLWCKAKARQPAIVRLTAALMEKLFS